MILLEGRADAFPVKVADMVSCHGFGFSTEGWHPYIETLRQYVSDPEIAFKDTVLHRYYQSYQPASVAEVLFNSNEETYHPLNTWPPSRAYYNYPWRLSRSMLAELSSNPQVVLKNGQHFGPAIGKSGEKHFLRLKAVYNSLKQEGYRPERFPNGFIKGYFITDFNTVKFVLTRNGNHRVAAMSLLGFESVMAVKDSAALKLTVTPDMVQKVASGDQAPFDLNIGFDLFNMLIAADGKRKASEIGIN